MSVTEIESVPMNPANGEVSLNARTRRKKSRQQKREGLAAFLFLLPNITGFLIFTLIPIIASLALSFFKWPLIQPPRFVGFQNYVDLFGHDPLFAGVVLNTLYFVVVYVALNIVISLAFAVWLTQKIKGVAVFRAILFLPVLVPPVAIAMIWQWIYNPNYGLLNSFLLSLGIHGPNWLGNTHWAMPALIIMTVWQQFGYNMLIFMAGLQGIPQSLLEAADIDGAGKWQKFIRITFPMMSPSIFFGMVMTLITSFQTFDQVFVLTSGGPGNATDILGLYVYNNAFQYFRMGYGATVAVVMFIFILIVTVIQLRLQRRWVYYEAS